MPKDEPQREDDAARVRRRGRPPRLSPAAREAAILDAMERLVAEKGFRGASMAAIARAAGMSKRTLYLAFESRDALFRAWVRRVRASLIRPLPPEAAALPLAERLRRLLRRDAEASARDPRLAVLRAVVAEAPTDPELACAFHREGPGAARAIVAEELRRARARGEIALDDVEAAAAILCDMACPSPLDRLIDPAAPEAPAAPRLELALRIFLDGAAARAAGGAGA